jgi:hypothetical protein
MRYLILLLLTSCAINTPFWGPDVEHLCEPGTYTVTHDNQTRTFTVNVLPPDDVWGKCGASACVFSRRDIYVPEGRTCGKSLAHEMSHVWGYDWVDGAPNRGGEL